MGTADGLRAIGEVEPGDRVWAYNFRDGTWRLCMVECRHDAEYDGLLVTLDLGKGEVTATAYHPFWVVSGEYLEARPIPRHVAVDEDLGGMLAGRWVNSHDVRTGDVVFLRGCGPVEVVRAYHRPARTPVCNLTVEELHSFAVGEVQALVHNTSGTAGCHPILATKPADRVAELVMGAKPSTRDLPRVNHRYTNPGHHDPTPRSRNSGMERYDPSRSILPSNHVELFERSVVIPDGNGRPVRWAVEQTRNGPVYHRFQPHHEGVYHWTGSTDGVTASGTARPLTGPIPSGEINRLSGP